MPMKSSPSNTMTLPGGDADAQRQDDAGVLHPLGEVEHRLDHRPDLGAHEHAAVAEPLAHPDAVVGREPAHDRPELGQHREGLVVAEGVVHAREAAHVDEREAPEDPHPDSLADGRAATRVVRTTAQSPAETSTL